MPDKTILLYDAANTPLKVTGIHVELFDAAAGTLLQTQTSANLNPAAGNASVEWGVILNFAAGATPLDILITDPKYRYPGNTVRYLNGGLQDKVFIDLLQLPVASSAQSTPASAKPQDLVSWADTNGQWTEEEREAVLNLAFNYMRVIVAARKHLIDRPDLAKVAANWEGALERVGIPKDLFEDHERTPPRSTSGTPKTTKHRERFIDPPTAGTAFR